MQLLTSLSPCFLQRVSAAINAVGYHWLATIGLFFVEFPA
jgi:hypothetical protein